MKERTHPWRAGGLFQSSFIRQICAIPVPNSAEKAADLLVERALKCNRMEKEIANHS
jgi:hypothetical protein